MAFKKFSDGLLSAGTLVANPLSLRAEQADKVRLLESMGFDLQRARHALNATEGNVDRAAELLLQGINKATSTRINGKKKKAIDAHPNVQLPQKLSDKSKEEQVLRCAHRVKPHIMAVDTLLRVLTSVRDSPDNPKFRTIDRANANYVTFVKDKPGAEDLLLAMNYRRIPRHNELRLERHLVDEALLFLGISALERMRTTPEYKEGKQLRKFHAEMRRVAGQNGSSAEMPRAGLSEGETALRSALLSQCPKEPPEGRGTRVVVHLGAESENIAGGHVERRFDGDDTLEDVLNFLGGCYGNEVLEKIRGSVGGSGNSLREWCLCDMNCYPILPLDVEKHRKNTLQYLGLFPGGKLGVRLSDESWRDRSEGGTAPGGSGRFDRQGSLRGLGAASRSMLI